MQKGKKNPKLMDKVMGSELVIKKKLRTKGSTVRNQGSLHIKLCNSVSAF